MSKLIIGIDPGLTGAVATNGGVVWDIPTVTKDTGTQATIKNHVHAKGLYNILYYAVMEARSLDQELVVYLERQYYMKKINPKTKQEIYQGGSSIFSLGDTYGVCRATVDILGIDMVTVTPSVWKRRMGVTYDKKNTLAKARELFPESGGYLKRMKDHNRAEALLLAKYGESCEGK